LARRCNLSASAPEHGGVDGALRYRRVLLKLSGEALSGAAGYGIDPGAAALAAAKIQELTALGTQVAIVIGAGNLWRGSSAPKMDRATADYMGMLATVMNALAMQDALEQLGLTVRVHTAIEMREVAEPYIRRRAIHQLERGHVIVLAAGTGNPFFTTDTAAALRATELGAAVLVKATKVDGVYTADPFTDPAAERLPHVSYQQALVMGLRVMDMTAFALCRENHLPIIVLDLWAPGSLVAAVRGDAVGTLVDDRDGALAAARGPHAGGTPR
jgi:uridylate kinase